MTDTVRSNRLAKPRSSRSAGTRTPGGGRGERKSHEERWPEIVDAAAEIFWEKGYDAATLQDIADRVGILKGSLYYYIASKTDLRAQVLHEVHHSRIDPMRRLTETAKAPLHRLYDMCFAHILHVCANLARTAVFLREIRRISAAEKAEIGIDDRTYSRLFQGAIAAARDAGQVRPDIDVELAGYCTLGALNSVYTWYKRDAAFAPEAIARHLAKSTVRGLATPEGTLLLDSIVARLAPL